jgi:hypothetical protein
MTAAVFGVRHRLDAWCDPSTVWAVLVTWFTAAVCLLVAPVYAWILLTRASDCIDGAVPCGLGPRLAVGTYLGGLVLVGVGVGLVVAGRRSRRG